MKVPIEMPSLEPFIYGSYSCHNTLRCGLISTASHLKCDHTEARKEWERCDARVTWPRFPGKTESRGGCKRGGSAVAAAGLERESVVLYCIVL